ncbi:hypothetical protein [Agrobacterium tumefaciens]|uniref:hypothetical protein n=1 Tax=Agrobacterium tumefaciens TaxID=358 RepID=UPI001571D51A|nr:hypothetical protein [Agrobacterium tumefaciens]NTB05868.1 hypothetical protein [Agrobacterium tumefaciens]
MLNKARASMESKQGSTLKVPFGRHGDLLVGPTEELSSGLACECICPGCGARLLLRQGRRRRHFAHYNAPGSAQCISQAIHSAAIQVLMQTKQVRIPPLSLSVGRYANSGEYVERRLDLCKERIIHFDECYAELTISDTNIGTIRPDVVGCKGERQLFIEMWYTHQVDEEKKAKLARFGVAAIEIWLSDLDLDEGFAAIEKRVLEEPYRHWLFYPGSAEATRRLQEEVGNEVRRLNELHERKLAKARLRAEQRATNRLKARQREAAAALAKRLKEDEQFLPFRNKSAAEKETALRVRLGIKGKWPYYLRLPTPHNRAVESPARIWQAAVFYHFIFKKPHSTSFELLEVLAWVRNWFGEAPGIEYQLVYAIKSFLFYLKGCGFLAYAGPGTGGRFSVAHSDLEPPPRQPPTPVESLAELGKDKLDSAEFRNIKHLNEGVRWASSWPQYDTVKSAIVKWLSMSRQDELALLDALFEQRENLPTPLQFAAIMHNQMPLTTIFNFLRNYQFVE